MQPIYIHAVSALCSLGNLSQTMTRLTSPQPYPDEEPSLGRIPDLYLERAQKSLNELSPSEQTRGVLIGMALLLQLQETLDALRNDDKTLDAALILGNATSGLNEVLSNLAARANGETLSATEAILPLELGAPASILAKHLRLTGPAYCVSTACTAGAKALCDGARLLLSHAVPLVIAGGTDVLNDFTQAGFGALSALSATRAAPFSKDRDGLHLGEGGALFVMSLEKELNGKPALALLSGWGETSDAHHISAPHPEGKGAIEAMKEALKKARLEASQIDFIHLHGTGTPQNDITEAKAIASLFKTPVACASTKRATGHLLAGAGALGTAIATQLLGQTALPIHWAHNEEENADTTLSPIRLTSARDARSEKALEHILINAFAFGGNNVSLICCSPQSVTEDFCHETIEALTQKALSLASNPSAIAALPKAAPLLAQTLDMGFLDHVVGITPQGAVSMSTLRSDSILVKKDRASSTGLIEYMAQTIGLFAGKLCAQKGLAPKMGLLLGSRRLNLARPYVHVGDVITVSAQALFRSEEGLWQFDCQVYLNTEKSVAAQGVLTVFDAPDDYLLSVTNSNV